MTLSEDDMRKCISIILIVFFSMIIWQYKVINICHNIDEINKFTDENMEKAIEEGVPLSVFFLARDESMPDLSEKVQYLNNILKNEYKGWELHEIIGCDAIIKKNNQITPQSRRPGSPAPD